LQRLYLSRLLQPGELIHKIVIVTKFLKIGHMTRAVGISCLQRFHLFPIHMHFTHLFYTPHTLYIECSDSYYRASWPVQLPCQCSLCPQTYYAPSIRVSVAAVNLDRSYLCYLSRLRGSGEKRICYNVRILGFGTLSFLGSTKQQTVVVQRTRPKKTLARQKNSRFVISVKVRSQHHVIAYTSIEFRFNSIEVECHVSCSLVYIIIVAGSRREVARYYAALEPSTVQCMYIVQYHFTRSSLHLLLERVYYLERGWFIDMYRIIW
jgi:hypothetical protein